MEYININNEIGGEGLGGKRKGKRKTEREGKDERESRKRDLLVISICSVGGLSLMGISSDNWENLIKAIVGSIKTTLISMHYEQPNLTEGESKRLVSILFSAPFSESAKGNNFYSQRKANE